jgi:hypothetical protein
LSEVISLTTGKALERRQINAEAGRGILAFHACTVMRNVAGEEFYNGGRLICELARCLLSGTPPSEWTTGDCADVVQFLYDVDPAEGHCFCNDPNDGTSTIGYQTILLHIVERLREIGDVV